MSIFQKDLFDKHHKSMAELIAGDLRLAFWLIAFYSLSIVLPNLLETMSSVVPVFSALRKMP